MNVALTQRKRGDVVSPRAKLTDLDRESFAKNLRPDETLVSFYDFPTPPPIGIDVAGWKKLCRYVKKNPEAARALESVLSAVRVRRAAPEP